MKPRASKIDFRTGDVGDSASMILEVNKNLVDSFAEYTGDFNPLHVDDDYASKTNFKRRVVHGMAYGSFISKLIGMDLPGEGSLWISQSFNFLKPVFIGDKLHLQIEITHVVETTQVIRLKVNVTNQDDEEVMSGNGEVMVLETTEPKSENQQEETKLGFALVTGGSRGIGASVVRKLAEKGHPVVFTYFSRSETAQELARELTEEGKKVFALQFNGQEGESGAERLAEKVLLDFGIPQILVFCGASTKMYGGAEDVSWSRIEDQLNIHVASTLRICQVLVSKMERAGGGSIVLIGTSFLHGEPPKKMLPYLIAKEGTKVLMKVMASEFGPKNIRVNMVSPSMTDTELLSKVPPRQVKVAAAQNPMKRLAEPLDVANSVEFLASDNSSYVNGHEILVTGGSKIL